MNGDAARETMAARLARMLKANREDQLEEMIQRIEELGSTDERATIDRVMSEWRSSKWSAKFPNPVDGMFQHLTAEVKTALKELSNRPERLSSLSVAPLKHEAVSARLRPLQDGSALVYFSDGTLSLCALYSRYAAECMTRLVSGGLMRSLPRITKAQLRKGMGENPGVLAGLLRYYMVNQRAYALSARLNHRLTAEAEEMAVLLQFQTAAFVLGHEMAHHVLEHSPAPSGFSPSEDLAACTDSHRMEFEADLLAHRIAVKVVALGLAHAPVPRGLAGYPEVGGALGAMIGMVGLHAVEQALFIRRGRTHPPAAARAARLIERFPAHIRDFVELFLGDLLWATEVATDFSESGHPFNLEWFEKTPQVDSPLPDYKIRMVHLLDAIQCRSRRGVAELLDGLLEDSSVPRTDATRAALAGDARTALLHWGVPPAQVDKRCDPLKALEFSALVEDIYHGFGTIGVPEKARRSAAVAATRLLAEPLAGRAP